MNNTKEFLADLNTEQLEAATTLDGNVLIIAGAGSGKTKTLISRTANLLDEGINPEEILLLTFTKKAAQEMKSRICDFPHITNGDKIVATTFHSFCCDTLRHFARLVGFSNDFQIMSEGDSKDAINIQADIIRKNYKDKNIKIENFPSNSLILSVYSKSVSDLITLDKAIQMNERIDPAFSSDVKTIITNYNRYKKEKQMMDFEDLLLFMYRLLTNNENIRSKLDASYKYIMCDEYQDTNVIQEELLKLLSRDIKNLCVVGDDNQSIYKFRGAHIENILTFEERYDNVRKIILNKNYRSTKEILAFANSVMSYAIEGQKKELVGFTSGEVVKLTEYFNQRKEAKAVVEKIKEQLSTGLDPKEIAIIARNGNITTFVEQELQKNNIPFKKFGGISFFERAIIRDILSYVRALLNPEDELAVLRILTLYPKIGTQSAIKINEDIKKIGLDALGTINNEWIQKLYNVFNQAASLEPYAQIHLFASHYQELNEYILSQSKSSDQKRDEKQNKLFSDMELIPSLEEMAKDYKSVSEMLEDFYLNAPAKNDKDTDYINITTVHSAKGLEYDTVYLIDPIQGIFPHYGDYDSEDIKEDLRVMYVAITRPKNHLYISYPSTAFFNGNMTAADLSIFLQHDSVLKECQFEAKLNY